MPIVHVQVLEGRQPDKIQKMIKNITTAVSQILDVPPERVRVIVTESLRPTGRLEEKRWLI